MVSQHFAGVTSQTSRRKINRSLSLISAKVRLHTRAHLPGPVGSYVSTTTDVIIHCGSSRASGGDPTEVTGVGGSSTNSLDDSAAEVTSGGVSGTVTSSLTSTG